MSAHRPNHDLSSSLSNQSSHSQFDALAINSTGRRQPTFPCVVFVARIVRHTRLVPLDTAGTSHPKAFDGRLVRLEAAFVPHESAPHRGWSS